jgi:hypothetical protein
MHEKVNFAFVSALLFLVAALMTDALPHKDSTDDSDAHPPVPKDDLKIVRRAREILNDPAKWNRSDTRKCPDDAKTFSLYCSLEKATREVTGDFQHHGAAMQEARFAIDQIAPNRQQYHPRLIDYNNDPSTTFRDIRKVFDLMEKHITKRLGEQSPGTSH